MGVLNEATVSAAGESFLITFNGAFKGVEPMWGPLAMEAPSQGAGNNYVWLGMIPQLKEWLGERQVHNLEAFDYYLKNKKFELTIGIPREAWEDDQLGVYRPVIQSMGGQAARHPDKLVFALLLQSFTKKGYDGVPFVSTAHPGGADDEDWSNKGTAKLTADSFKAARTAIMSLTDKHGEPLGITRLTLVVSPKNEYIAKTILTAEKIGGETNVLRGSAELLVSQRLATKPEYWFLIAEVDTLKPFIFQMRRPATFTAKDKLDDDNVFWDGQAVYGVDGRWNAGFGLPQLIWGSDGTTG